MHSLGPRFRGDERNKLDQYFALIGSVSAGNSEMMV
jgi:hypothetical protein